MLAPNEVAQNILNSHGNECDTYKTASSFMKEWEPIFNNYTDESKDSEDKMLDLETDFLNDLLEDYRVIYNKDIEYQNSDEYITKTIEANEYEFTQDGKMN